MKKFVVFALLGSLSLLMLNPIGEANADAADVKVTIPGFKVKLNGNLVDNTYRKYPLLVYKDITYFPMTWYDARLLGLEASWSEQGGLSISQGQVASAYVSYKSDYLNTVSSRAGVPASAITVNGQTIENAKEEYPLLSFRDVTYFPLTWRFAHDQFNWDYSWDSVNGLSIQSHNPQLAETGLPDYVSQNNVALYKGYYYFVETQGATNHVYRSPVKNPTKKETVYEYNLENGFEMQKGVSFELRDEVLWLSYHMGGVTMGHDVYVKISADGKATVAQQGYLDFRETAYGTIIVNEGNPPFAGNLSLTPSGKDRSSAKLLGSSDIMYGRHLTVNTDSIGVGDDDGSLTVVGDSAYVMGSAIPKNNSNLNNIYKINLQTGASLKLVNASVSRFRVLDNKLYYVKDADNALYRSDLDGTGEMKLTERSVDWFSVAGGKVFYTSPAPSFDGKVVQAHLYQANPDGEDRIVLHDSVKAVQVKNDRLICVMGDDAPYGMELLDFSGRLLLKVANPIARMQTSDDGILVATSSDSSLRTISLTDK
ncbi:DUF5050 domain-containing protein [Paenibacillus qinlingensis]|uniref:DUF5050 domain-containing protein n=1 Tax=Paenibacillus qinlingensis TaxID=1837343 RepID=UPI0015661722|nr:DUF5050 domain-containing protein [Paenibacillus qinlingensis]NQX57513.1 DUF5050 domain-containing protein [Paenibacillus qinlingensis]